MSKSRVFIVSLEKVCEFADFVAENDLCNCIIGSEEDDILVEVIYKPKERHLVFDLIEMLDESDESDNGNED